MTPANRTELQRQWQKKWKIAELELEAARVRLQSIENDPFGVDGPDGGYAYRAALRHETAALIKYSRVLRIYTDLVLNGRVPDDEDQAVAGAE